MTIQTDIIKVVQQLEVVVMLSINNPHLLEVIPIPHLGLMGPNLRKPHPQAAMDKVAGAVVVGITKALMEGEDTTKVVPEVVVTINLGVVVVDIRVVVVVGVTVIKVEVEGVTKEAAVVGATIKEEVVVTRAVVVVVVATMEVVGVDQEVDTMVVVVAEEEEEVTIVGAVEVVVVVVMVVTVVLVVMIWRPKRIPSLFKTSEGILT